MAGIYIHVPFCHRKCAYCDFYSVGKGRLTDDFASLLVAELRLRKEYLPTRRVETVYLGGGTPSILPVEQVEKILNGIGSIFSVSADAEITLEANPDDVTLALLRGYRQVGVNRISVGVQSFNDCELELLGRRHNARQGSSAAELARRAGIPGVSLDLIYGIPGSTLRSWEYSLRRAIELDVQHLSCYHLTYEAATPLTRKLQKGLIGMADEELSVGQFDMLRQVAQANGFLHYEISNFAREGFTARHNSSYWLGVPYLGIGPSAHSFNIETRQWNPSSIDEWTKGIAAGTPSLQSEAIDETSRFNELLLTRLRTIWGVDLSLVDSTFPEKYANHLRERMAKHLRLGNLMQDLGCIRIPAEHYLISDSIVADLWVE